MNTGDDDGEAALEQQRHEPDESGLFCSACMLEWPCTGASDG